MDFFNKTVQGSKEVKMEKTLEIVPIISYGRASVIVYDSVTVTASKLECTLWYTLSCNTCQAG